MVVAASPSPSPSPAPAPHAAAGRPHPTYTTMITHALTELGGWSARPAIAGYIHDRFSGFPASHDALLSAHLRRLVAEGALRTNGADSPSYILAPTPTAGEKRGPGRPRKDGGASTPVATAPGEKRGPGRPRKSPQGSSEKAAPFSHTGIATTSRGQSPTAPRHDQPLQPGDDDSVTNGRPTAREATDPVQADEARAFQNGGDATPVRSGGASSTGIKRGPGRPRKEKPPVAAAAMSPEPVKTPSTTGSKRGRGRPRKEKPSAAPNSPTTGVAASRGFKRGCGRPTMDRASAPAAAVSPGTSMEKLAAAAAAMYAETGHAASTGKESGDGQSRMEKLAAAVAAMSAEGMKRGRGRPRKEKPPAVAGVKRSHGRPGKDRSIGAGQSTMEKLAAAVAAMSAEGIKRGRGRPRKEKPPAVAGVKRSRGRPGKVRSIGAGLVESAYEAFFREMMTEASTSLEEEEDSVSGEKTQTEKGVAPVEGKETRAADAGCVPVSGENAVSAPAGATDPDLGPANLADDAASTGIKRPRGRPRKRPAAAADDVVSTGVKRGRGRPRKENPAAAATSFPETGDAASTGVKRGVGRPRKNPAAASTGVKRAKRGRGRPRKHRNSIGTGFVEAAGKVLFRDVTKAPGDLVSGEKTQTEGAAPRDRKETRAADAGCVPVSGENAASSPLSALGSDSGPVNL